MAGRLPKAKLPKHYPSKGLFAKLVDAPVEVVEAGVLDTCSAKLLHLRSAYSLGSYSLIRAEGVL